MDPSSRAHRGERYRWPTGATCAYSGNEWRLAPVGSLSRALARYDPLLGSRFTGLGVFRQRAITSGYAVNRAQSGITLYCMTEGLELERRIVEDPVGPSAENNQRISFRPIGRSDFPILQKWLAAPHVAVWWNEHFDLASLEAKYGPWIDASEPIHAYLIQFEGAPIGWIQWYRWRDFPKHAIQLGADYGSAGIDLAIGEIEMTGRGLGPAVIREFGRSYIFANGDMGAIVADPSVSNLNSVSAFKKAGFNIVSTVQLVDEAFERHVVRLGRTEE